MTRLTTTAKQSEQCAGEIFEEKLGFVKLCLVGAEVTSEP